MSRDRARPTKMRRLALAYMAKVKRSPWYVYGRTVDMMHVEQAVIGAFEAGRRSARGRSQRGRRP